MHLTSALLAIALTIGTTAWGQDRPAPTRGEGKLVLFDTYANVRRMTEIIDALAR